jgi:ABC-type polysaccharide/polyol phosphate transport system ATPase subunit
MIAIEAQRLSKVYRIYAKPADRLKEWLTSGRRYHREFWALRDVSFHVKTGTTLGLIGDNGAGKSTLLALVAGVLRPTSGQVATRGRVSTILELGTGFNPEFTGRENAMMSGTILGISPKEMEKRFSELAAFAEIGDFMEQPVKFYSSGMYVRLAFAVATTIDPDVLIIDEALSVGDVYFQKRCFDRIDSFRKAGKTILFCSHDLYYVRMICDEVIWLRDGRMHEVGEASRVVGAYENYLRERELPSVAPQHPVDNRTAFPWIEGIRITQGDGSGACDTVMTGDDLMITVSFCVPQPPTPCHVGVVVTRNDGTECFGTGTHIVPLTAPTESGRASLHLPRLALLSGEYALSVFLLDENGWHIYDRRVREVRFRVAQRARVLGLCYLDHWWEVEPSGGHGKADASFGPHGDAAEINRQ